MKKICKAIILYIWGTGVFIPWIYYKLFGYVYVYQAGACPTSYFDKAAVLLTISFGMLLLIIHLSIYGKEKINFTKVSKFNAQRLLYVSAAFYVIYFLWLKLASGLNNQNLPMMISYLTLFIEPITLYVLSLFSAVSMKEVVLYSSFYLLISIVSSSRSGVFWIFIFVICYLCVASFKVKMKTIIILGICGVLLAVPLYISSTAARYNMSYSEYMVTYGKGLINNIIGRLSFLELGGNYLYAKDTGNYDAVLFKDKFSFLSQILQSIDNIIPGSLFSANSIHPNQYIRTIFWSYPIEISENYYTSIFMTAPLYFIFKYSEVTGIIIFLGIGYLIFRGGAFMNKIGKWYWGLLLCTIVLREYLELFDWVYLSSRLFSMILTCGFAIILNKFLNLRVTEYYD